MATFLFDEIIFGPVYSRRLGISLGINLLPPSAKYCNFSCVYCECGWTKKLKQIHLPSVREVKENLEFFLKDYKKRNKPLHSITFAGNGEPTLHPEFHIIIDDVIALRNKYYPEAKISVLSNASMLKKNTVCNALKKIDKPIMKLDAGITEIFHLINRPLAKIEISQIVENLKCFEGNFIMQTLFVRGFDSDEKIDNTTNENISAWLDYIKILKPREVMIYSIARDTPLETLQKIPPEELEQIAEKVEQLGIKTQVF